MTNDTLTTAPERIWLQIDPAGAPIDYAEPFPADAEGVSDFFNRSRCGS